MWSAALTEAGNVTRAVSVAKLTVAATPSSLFSFFSTRAAHDEQVIPPMASSTARRSATVVIGVLLISGCEAPRDRSESSNSFLRTYAWCLSGELVVPRLVQRGRDQPGGQRLLAVHGHRGFPAGDQGHPHVAHAVQA